MANLTTNDVSRLAHFLRQNIGNIDKNHDGVVEPREVADFVSELGIDPASRSTVEPKRTMGELFAGALLPRRGSEVPPPVDLYAILTGAAPAYSHATLPGSSESYYVRTNEAVRSVVTGKEKFAALNRQLTADGVVSVEWGRAIDFELVVLAADLRGKIPEDTRPNVIRRLDEQIAVLETENAAKVTFIDDLVKQIAARRSEIARQHEEKRSTGIFATALGFPAVGFVSLVEMSADDARIRELDVRLTQARADQASVGTKLAEYRAFKADVAAKLKALVPAPIPFGTPVAAMQVLQKAEALLLHRSPEMLRAQIELLTSVRDRAIALGVDIDDAIAQLTVHLARAKTLVEASKKATFELIKLLLSPDREAAALSKLQGMVRAEIERALAPVVDRLLTGAPPALAQELKKRLMGALLSSFERGGE